MRSKANDLIIVSIDDESLDSISCSFKGERFDYPTVALTGATMYFNAAFARIFHPPYIRISINTEWVVIEAANQKSIDSFKTRMSGGAIYTTYPAELKAKSVREGLYKIYRCRQGYAFKRNEAIK